MTEINVVCKWCPRHCVIGTLAVNEPPKDSKEPVLDKFGNDYRAICKEIYEEVWR